jgi:hypothetical protein
VAVAEKMSGSISGWQWQGGSRVRRVRRFEVDVQKKIGRNRSSIEGVVAFLVQVDGIVAVAKSAVAEKKSGSISGWQWQGVSRVRRVRRFEVVA